MLSESFAPVMSRREGMKLDIQAGHYAVSKGKLDMKLSIQAGHYAVSYGKLEPPSQD